MFSLGEITKYPNNIRTVSQFEIRNVNRNRTSRRKTVWCCFFFVFPFLSSAFLIFGVLPFSLIHCIFNERIIKCFRCLDSSLLLMAEWWLIHRRRSLFGNDSQWSNDNKCQMRQYFLFNDKRSASPFKFSRIHDHPAWTFAMRCM